jgi:hypothetical protein
MTTLAASTIVTVPIVKNIADTDIVNKSSVGAIVSIEFNGSDIMNQLYFCSNTYISNEGNNSIRITIDTSNSVVVKLQ